ncbi:unnamed protein product [Coregonus sp. 'balchen']|nr:unnamed protein product [Coregonus sp. 'balchen']
MDWEAGRTMEGVSITHWVNSPVRHQALFQGRELDDCVEDHDLFALPGPAFPDPGVFEGWLLIKAQHGARMDEHGFVTRSFTRQYTLPEKLQRAGDLRALLCHDGILVVESKQRTPVRIQPSEEEDPY